MSYKVITTCPICSKKLKVVRLKCSNCNTVIENEFEFSKLHCLSNEQTKFVEAFLKCRGNIKDVEKTLGVSYPTVRAKLDEVLGALGYANLESNKQSVDKNKVLEDLETGKITADEALKMLNE